MYAIFDIKEENQNASFEYPYHILTELQDNFAIAENMKYVCNEQAQMCTILCNAIY